MFILDHQSTKNCKYLVKYVLLMVLDLACKVILTFKRHKKQPKKYGVSICGIFKDEAHNMREWIEYHRIIGIDHFYIYNNFSTDNYQQVLAPYIEQGLVTLTEWPIAQGQMQAYKHCYENFKHEYQWVCFLDFDEFIVPRQELTINDWLKKFSKYPSVMVYWRVFGTSGRLQHDPTMPTIEQYTVCWEKLDGIGKIFFNSDFPILNYTSMHTFYSYIRLLGVRFIIPPINQFSKFVHWNIHRHNGFNKTLEIQINHYWSKAYETYYLKKNNKGDAFFADGITHNMSQFWAHEPQNRSVDHSIFRFVIQLKLAMGFEKNINKTNGGE